MENTTTSNAIVNSSGQSSLSIAVECVEFYYPGSREAWESMVFESIEEIKSFYGDYAYNNGFSIRVYQKSMRNSNNKITDRVHYVAYVCNKHGYKRGSRNNPKNNPSSDSPLVIEFQKVKEKSEERVGCKAGIYLKLVEALNVYTIYKWEGTHNHELHKPEHLRYLRSFRQVNDVQKQIALINMKAGMSVRTSFEVMGEGVGGTDNLPFRFSDLKNYLNTIRQKEMAVGDASAIQEYFRNEALSKPSFYYDIQVDSQEDIASIFWADGIMRMDYSLFGDVVSFDTTYRTNNQYRPLAAFIGFDNHRKSVLFGAALLYDETSATFDWLFATFLKCMSNKKPQTIYTDQASALLKSVPTVFEGVFHGLCSWHLAENAKKNLGSRANSVFFDEFNHLVNDVDDESEFDYSWEQMMKNCFDGKATSTSNWLSQTYKNRAHWSSAWVKNYFTAGLKTTQLSESFNAFLRRFLQPDHSLVKFFGHFNLMVQRMRSNHADLDFQAANTTPKNNYPNSQLMQSVVNIYTPTCFAFIHRQYDLSFKYYYEEDTTKGSDDIKVYNVFSIEVVNAPEEVLDDNESVVTANVDTLVSGIEDYSRRDERVVTIDVKNKIYSCTCRMFENRGFLCRHVFKILEFLGGSLQYLSLRTLGGEYVLKRWTRDVRPSIEKFQSTISHVSEGTTEAQRYQQICAVMVHLSTRICRDPDACKLFLDGVLDAGKKAEELLLSKAVTIRPSSLISTDSSIVVAAGESPVDGASTKVRKLKKRQTPPIRSKQRMKSHYEMTRNRQKLKIERKKQMILDEALKNIS